MTGEETLIMKKARVLIVLGLIQAFFLSIVITAVGFLTMHQLGNENKSDKK